MEIMQKVIYFVTYVHKEKIDTYLEMVVIPTNHNQGYDFIPGRPLNILCILAV